MLKYLIILSTLVSTQLAAQECVILLHGLARSNQSMAKLAKRLDRANYLSINYDYPSTQYTIEELAATTLPDALAQCPPESKVHFVTHSMGGILLRQYLSSNEIDNLGRVVMLGPPNQGSQVVDKLRNTPGYQLINGPAGLQLGTDAESVPNRLGPVDFELGVIAGTRSINLILSTMLPNPDDGKVSVENTKLEGMTDHIEMPVTHPFMMKNKAVMDQVLFFLKNGAFSRE